jgi:hypothetical protein
MKRQSPTVSAGAVLLLDTILASWLVDSNIEILVKNGPFGNHHPETSPVNTLLGNDQRFAHLGDPHIAYQQLVGVLGRPVIQVSRLGTWLELAPVSMRASVDPLNQQRALLNSAFECRRTSAQPFESEDWAVRISSPLVVCRAM